MEATEMDVLSWKADNTMYHAYIYAYFNEYLFVIMTPKGKNHNQTVMICEHISYEDFHYTERNEIGNWYIKNYRKCHSLEDAKAKAELFILKQIKK